jgi:hypothetical protein
MCAGDIFFQFVTDKEKNLEGTNCRDKQLVACNIQNRNSMT